VTSDRDALLELDRALDELAEGAPAAGAAAATAGAAGEVAAGEVAALAALAAELRAAVPPAPPAAAAHGRAALLAAAAAPPGAAGRRRAPSGLAGRDRGAVLAGPGASRRRRLPRVRVLAAAALLAVAVPAALAGRALPGTPLWPLRQAGQQVRLGLTADPVQRAHLRLNTAAMLLDAARDSGGYRQAGLVQCREQLQAATAQLAGRTGPAAAAERARAEGLLADLGDLERSAQVDGERDGGDGGDDRSGPGGGGSGRGGSGGSGGEGSGRSGGSDDSGRSGDD
jgi:hypothetical protein